MSLRLTPAEFDAIKRGLSEKKPVRLRQNDNKYKAQVELILIALLADFVKEHKFHPARKWRFDFALIIPVNNFNQTCNTGKSEMSEITTAICITCKKINTCQKIKRVAVEYEGLPLQTEKSRHTTIKGFCGDCEKYSEAAILGWCVIRVNAVSVDSGLAHDLIRRAVDSRRIGYETIGERNRLTREEL